METTRFSIPNRSCGITSSSAVLLAFFLLLFACSTGPAPSIGITLSPTSADVHAGQTIQFSATVRNSTNAAVTWSLSGNGCGGATCGTISDSGLYTAPASVPSPPTVTVKATAATDTSKSASAVVTILAPEIIVILYPSSSSVIFGHTLQFTATVHNSPDQTVIWSLSGDGCNGVTCGTVSDSGLYTAPAGIPVPPTVTVKATATADGSKSASAIITIVAPYGYLNDLWKYDGVKWIWVSGDHTTNQRGVYGTKGLPDPANIPGGRYMRPTLWQDLQGNLWLFGGLGYDRAGEIGELNDLWKFDQETQEWTWISGGDSKNQRGVYGTKGTPDPANVPGARDAAASWTDTLGNFWVFGGFGWNYISFGAHLSDLWKFDPTTEEWTWISGNDGNGSSGPTYGTKGVPDPANTPGGRHSAVTWIDPLGQFWLFGGYGWATDTQGYLNDLWRFDPVSLQWTWISGGSTTNQLGVYGTKGVPSSTNAPRARESAVSWIDPLGRFWLFGGATSTTYLVCWLNDLWMFDPSSLDWTWVSGSVLTNQPGIYGTLDVGGSLNVPGARFGSISGLDASANFRLFGGGGYDAAATLDDLNDLWSFNPSAHEWTWIGGSSSVNQPGKYGTMGIGDPLNSPGARRYAGARTDTEGHLWLFGGLGYSGPIGTWPSRSVIR